MVHTVIYVMRGWIAFVAFIEYSNAIRCFIDEKEFVRNQLFVAENVTEHVTPAMARLLGRYCLLNGVIMSHCALCIHHIPIIVLSICSLTLSILLYGSEAFYYYTTAINFYVIFPILVAIFTIICLAIAPIFLEEDIIRSKPLVPIDEDDEEDYETMILKQRTGLPGLHHPSSSLLTGSGSGGGGGANKGKKTQ